MNTIPVTNKCILHCDTSRKHILPGALVGLEVPIGGVSEVPGGLLGEQLRVPR